MSISPTEVISNLLKNASTAATLAAIHNKVIEGNIDFSKPLF